MEKKPWYKSKAKIGAILIAIGAIGGFLAGKIDAGTAFIEVSAALGLFGIRDAQK